MIAETGHYALVLALALAILQSTLPLWGARVRDPALMGLASPLAVAQFLFVAISFGALTHAYVTSDFSLVNVVENSHSMKPLIYKISGTWGNHEGSLLLWILILVLFGALVALFGRNLPARLKADVLAVQAMISVAFLVFVLGTSNPFARLSPAPLEGQDLNPLLQDPGLAIHPPLLYMGYVGFSMAFSFAVAALIEGKVDAAWARWVRPWTLMAWVFLTLGIAMGSYWAYYVLGWGGFWFWDPVENASFMPWLSGTALLHSAVVMEKREALKVWTILLAILTFSLSLLGTFLVRSGVLTSVHAFAVDPARGVAILIILSVFVGGSLALYAFRAPVLKQGGIFAPVSREGALVVNNIFLTAACAAVFVGTLYPLALEAATGEKISVGAPFFNATFGPIMLPVLLVMPFGPLLAWKRGDALRAAQGLMVAFGVAILGTALVAGFLWGGPTLAPIGVGIALFAIVGGFAEIVERGKIGRAPLSESVRRLRGLPSSTWGGAIAHAGIGVTLLGIVAASAWSSEQIVSLKPGDKVQLAGMELTYDGAAQRNGPNYRESYAHLTVTKDGDIVTAIEPARRFYFARKMDLAQSAIVTFGWSQLYAATAESRGDGTQGFRLQYKPLVVLIWLGAIIMAFGGMLSIADRRLRVGAPRKAARPAPRSAARGMRSEGVFIPDGRRPSRDRDQNETQVPSHIRRTIPALRFAAAGMTAAVLLATAAPAFAVNPGEELPDPAQEARARALGAELRCMVCQNQSIDDSDATLAKDLRLLVRERVKAGDSDEQVLKFLTDRYGDFVLLRPVLRADTLFLWAFAPALLGIGLIGYCVWAIRSRRRGVTSTGLSEAERARVDALLASDRDGRRSS